MSDRLVSLGPTDEDRSLDVSLRPRGFSEYIGQRKVLAQLEIAVQAARERDEAMDHLLTYGPPGLGKTTLAHVVANELGVNIKTTAGPLVEKSGDLVALLTNLEARDVLFIDEIHRLHPSIEGSALSGDGGFQARHHHRPRALGEVGKDSRLAVHAHRRYDACGPLDFASPFTLRHRAPARLLHR